MSALRVYMRPAHS